jgi:hypothetical protein
MHDFGLLDMWKNLSSQFFDIGIENALGRGALAKFEPSMYVDINLTQQEQAERRARFFLTRQDVTLSLASLHLLAKIL